ncbi:hypothetical protein GCM10023340_28340 [Nocardioides marinquilinus]|uniref:Uncharacterized protein n=1 Tax=Nocardioides marinquilinus TaxID=1210400 RepID=A0ABP9PV15_9ACTN
MQTTLAAGDLREEAEAVRLADGRLAVAPSPALLRRLDAGATLRVDDGADGADGADDATWAVVRSGRAHAEASHLLRADLGPIARRRTPPPDAVLVVEA